MARQHNNTNNIAIRVVAAIAGVMTAGLFLAFVALAAVVESKTGCVILGVLLLVATLGVSRIVEGAFLDALNVTFYIAGCALIGYGASSDLYIPFLLLAGIGVLGFFLSGGFVLPLLSVVLFMASLSGQVGTAFFSTYPYKIEAIPVLGAFFLTHLLEAKLLEAKGFGMKVLEAKYKPLQLGLFVAAFCAVCGLSFGWGGGAYADGGIYNRGEYGWVLLGGLSVFIWMCLLVMAGRVMRVEDPVRQVGVYVLYPWYKNKKLTLSALFLREAR